MVLKTKLLQMDGLPQSYVLWCRRGYWPWGSSAGKVSGWIVSSNLLTHFILRSWISSMGER